MKERQFNSMKLPVSFLLLVTFTFISFNVPKEEDTYSRVNFKVGDYIQFESFNVPGLYLKIENLNAKLRKVNPEGIHTYPLWETVFVVEKGLANSTAGFYSFRAANKKGHYLRTVHRDMIIHPSSKATENIENATWKIDNGLADASLASFRAFNHRDWFIRHYNADVICTEITNGIGRKDATWKIIVRNDLKEVTPIFSDKDPVSHRRIEEPEGRRQMLNCLYEDKGNTRNNRGVTKAQLKQSINNAAINYCRKKGGIKGSPSWEINTGMDSFGAYLSYEITATCNCR